MKNLKERELKSISGGEGRCCTYIHGHNLDNIFMGMNCENDCARWAERRAHETGQSVSYTYFHSKDGTSC